MKKSIGMVALLVFGLAAAMVFAQAPAGCGGAAAAPAAQAVAAPLEAAAAAAQTAVAPAVEATAAAIATAAAPVAEELTIKGKVSVVAGPDGALQAIYINPLEGHGYKVDIVNGEGKTLADKAGKIVEVIGVDVNRLFTVKTIAVVE